MRNKNRSIAVPQRSAAPNPKNGNRKSNEPSTAGGRELRLEARPPARFSSLRSEGIVSNKQEPLGNTLLAQRYPFSGNSYFWRTATDLAITAMPRHSQAEFTDLWDVLYLHTLISFFMLIHLMQVDGFRRYCKCQDRHSRKACVNSGKSFRVTRTAGSIFRRAVGLKDFAVRSATVPAVGGS